VYVCVYSLAREPISAENEPTLTHTHHSVTLFLSHREREGGTFETRRGAQQLLYTRKKGESSATIERRTDRREEEEDEGRKRERKRYDGPRGGNGASLILKGGATRERDEKILFGSFRVFPREFATTSPLCAPKSVPPDFSFYKEYIFNNILLLLLVELGRFFFSFFFFSSSDTMEPDASAQLKQYQK